MKINPPLRPLDRLWTAEDVSHYLGVPVGTLYQWRCQRRGPVGLRVGRYLRYRESDVKEWVASLDSSAAS